jgi:hypothetical protein
LLKISTRTVDRYVDSGKLRSKKEWKIVYINASDVENLSWTWKKKQEILIPKKAAFKTKSIKKVVQEISTKESFGLNWVYSDLRNEIKEKDTFIAELSIRLWQAEEIAKNSVSLIDYKKSQFLLEESRSNLNQAIIDLESDKEDLEKKLNTQKTNNWILIIFLGFVFVMAIALFLKSI